MAACSSLPVTAPGHKVEVTRFEAPIQAEANTRHVQHCPLLAGATFGDLAHAYACEDGEITLANCRLDRAAGRALSADCAELLKKLPEITLAPTASTAPP